MIEPGLEILPGMGAAMNWLLQEYRSVHGGLSRLESELLRAFESRGETKASTAGATIIAK